MSVLGPNPIAPSRFPQKPLPIGLGESGSSSADRRPSSKHQAPEAQGRGPNVLGVAGPCLERLALEDRPWIGVEAIFLNGEQLGRLFHLDLEGGLLIQHIAKGSPADKAGLRGGSIPARILGRDVLLGGDLILEFNRQETCHANCHIREGSRITKLDRIPITYLRAYGADAMLRRYPIRSATLNYIQNRQLYPASYPRIRLHNGHEPVH